MTAIVTGEILFKHYVVAAAGNTTASSPAQALGDQVSTSAWAGGVANDLFDDITGAENAASTADYRGEFIHNTNASNTLVAPKAYISAETAGGASIALGADPTAASAVGAATAQAVTIANETTAPAGVTFTAPTTLVTGVALGDIPSGNVKCLWIRRTAANTSALSVDGVTITVGGDTGSL